MAYLGFDVLETMPSLGANADPTDTLTRTVARLDPGPGAVHVIAKADVPVLAREFAWLLESRAAITSFRNFLAARQGKLVPFWMPSWDADFGLAAAATALDAEITVYACGYTAFVSTTDARRYLALMPGDGSVITRKITAAVDNGDGTETLTLDSAIGAALDPAAAMVSYLLLMRLDTDDVEIAWESQTVATCRVPLLEVPKEVPAV